VDDVWSASYVGLYRAAGDSALQQYDDVEIRYDTDGDGARAERGAGCETGGETARGARTRGKCGEKRKPGRNEYFTEK
jgi:hypothetical protein